MPCPNVAESAQGWHNKPETARRVKQRISAVMKWCIAQGFRENNPADDRITAALGSNTQRPQHMKALPHSKVGAASGALAVLDAARRLSGGDGLVVPSPTGRPLS